jgi:environmental stress-induced protein Ves
MPASCRCIAGGAQADPANHIWYTRRVLRILTPARFRSQPWKTGGGVTDEIAETERISAARDPRKSNVRGGRMKYGILVRWPQTNRDSAAFEIRIGIARDRVPGPFSRVSAIAGAPS